MSAFNLESSAAGAAPRRTHQRPTPQDWEDVKDNIHEIYIENNNTLEHLIKVMKQRGFNAMSVLPQSM